MELKNINGVGPKTLSLFNNLEIFTCEDMLEFYPFRYDLVKFMPVKFWTNISGYVKCEIVSYPKLVKINKSLSKISFDAIDDTGHSFYVSVFNRPFLRESLKENSSIVLFGKYDNLKNTFNVSGVFFDKQDNTIEPIYHLTAGLSQNIIRKTINKLLTENLLINDYVPSYINEDYRFMNKFDALKNIHNPENADKLKQAKIKLIYEEFFKFMFKINYIKLNEKKKNGIERANIDDLSFYQMLPFSLTPDQISSCLEIKKDMSSNMRMNRLVLGDVGSGKTVVAEYAIYFNYLSGYQSAFMAPTEILAVQHFKNLSNFFKNTKMNIELLIGKMTKKEKENIYEKLKKGDIDLLIGTHSIIMDKVVFKNLGLVITDEQHRFGVMQRTSLEKKGVGVDVLSLSATPIPRTYALTLYGDTDISIIKTKPSGRMPIITKIFNDKNIKIAYQKIMDELKLKHQVFVVSPLIYDNETEVRSVDKIKEQLEKVFKDARIAIIHGKLKQEEKDYLMQNFVNGTIDILISTTVIEVGIDVPNASVMMIYDAEFFGLATLHQLRGRVGRNDFQSYCFLISNRDNERLKVLEESSDGFYITEKDFEMRKEGDIFGVMQSGNMNFKIGNIKDNFKILNQCKIDSEKFILEKKYLNNPLYEKIISDITFID